MDENINKFIFNVELAKNNASNVDAKIEAINDRINHLSERTSIGPFRILSEIVRVSTSPKQVAVLGKALVKIAPALQELEELKRQKSVIDMAIKNPEWMAATFADFDNDVDDAIESIFDQA